MGTVVVPWFSKNEWIETYKAAFSTDVNRWKDAKDTMLVWQARVEKLPAGIDVTLPLLQAKIVEADPTVENAVKSIFLASALQRFVTAIVKLPQTKYYRAQSMHNLAVEIGLPIHLVDLRNELVHGHGGWTGGETVHKALEVSYEWIKGYYWDSEFQKTQINHSSLSDITPEEWQSFLCLLRKYAKLTTSFAKKKILILRKVMPDLIQRLESLYSLDPEECTKAVVSEILLPELSSDFIKHLVKVNVCQCGCCINGYILKRVEPLLACFCKVEEGTELLLSCLLKKGWENSKLSSEWICIISGALLKLKCFSSKEHHCAYHSLVLEEPLEGVDWRRVVVELLEAQSEWTTDIANSIMESPKAGLTVHQREKIKCLLSLFSEGFQVYPAEESEVCSQIENVYTVDSILTAAKSLPQGDRRKLQRLRVSIVGPTTDLINADAPVGVLAYQSENSLLYKELIVHYPDLESTSPPCKRTKLQKT